MSNLYIPTEQNDRVYKGFLSRLSYVKYVIMKRPTFGDVVHQDVFTRLRLPMMSIPGTKHAGPWAFWMKKEDVECMQQCHALKSVTIPHVEVQDTGFPPVRVNGREYFSVDHIQPFKSIFQLSKKTVHVNLINRKHFPLRAQFILIQHANTHGLHSQVWTTRKLLRLNFHNTITVSENAVPVEIPFCDISDGMKDVHLIPVEERMQKYGVVEFYNAEQTSDPRKVLDFFTRGAMLCLITRRMLPALTQFSLYRAAKSYGFTSNRWITAQQVTHQKHQDIEPREGQFPIKLKLKTSNKLNTTWLYNADQLILRNFTQCGQCNIFGGKYKIRGILDSLHHFARSRGFTCPYWADQHQVEMLKETLKLLPNEHGVHVKSVTPGGDQVYYNLQQMENYDAVLSFVQGLTSGDIENLIDKTFSECKESGDDWGFS